MNQKKKIISIVISIALIAVIGIGATLAYMTSTAGTVTNTFTVGNIKAYIYEHEVNGKDELNGGQHKVYDNTNDGAKYDGTADEGYRKRVTESYYHLIPGDIVDKDPFMTIDAGSADCYIFIQLSGVDDLIAEDPAVSIIGLPGANWEKYSVADGKHDGIYIYKPSNAGYKVEISDTKEYVTDPLFTGIEYASNGRGSNIIVKEVEKEGTKTKTVTTELINKIELKGAAVQFDGMTDKDAAYEEVKAFFAPKQQP
ncbi:putative ribosomally synthesized peptide with SipW-like signal peptide [Lachnospiraceae bacterium PM6-15]|uniref:SipW-dependent-type signal peptide-containing protein n=1 Tax=Ohessyouella blattaphilus TaxID=2949333 RepID=UPI003E213995